MKLYGRLITGAALILNAIPAMAAEGLWDIYQIAQQRDPEIRAAAADRTAALEVVPQSKAGLLPDIGFLGTLDEKRFDDLEADDNSVSYSTDQFYSLQLKQPVFRRDRFIQYRQADSRVLRAEATYAAAEQDLMIRTAIRYFTVLGGMDNLEFSQSEKDAIARQLDQAKQRFDVGLIAITDVHEAQARYDLAVSEDIKAQNLLANAREALREITGKSHPKLQLLSPTLSLVGPDPASSDAWVKIALQQNYEYLAAKAAAETVRQEIERARSGHYPTLDLNVSQSYRDLSFGGQFSQERYDSTIGLELNIPVYKGGFVSSKTREARAAADAAQQRSELQRRATERRMRDTYRGVNTDIALVRALGQALVSTRAALDAAQVGFDVGTRTIVDVLNAQREVFRAKRDFARARYDYLLNTLRMKQAAGTLSDGDVERISANLRTVNPVKISPYREHKVINEPVSKAPTAENDRQSIATFLYRERQTLSDSYSFISPVYYPYAIGPLSYLD